MGSDQIIFFDKKKKKYYKKKWEGEEAFFAPFIK